MESNNKEMNRGVLTPRDVAKILQVSEPMVYKLFNLPDFPSFRLGKCHRVSEDAFDRWLETVQKQEVL